MINRWSPISASVWALNGMIDRMKKAPRDESLPSGRILTAPVASMRMPLDFAAAEEPPLTPLVRPGSTTEGGSYDQEQA